MVRSHRGRPGGGKHGGYGISKGGKSYGSAFPTKRAAKSSASWNRGKVENTGCMIALLTLPFDLVRHVVTRGRW